VRAALWLLIGAIACQNAPLQRTISQPLNENRLSVARLRAKPGSFDENSGLVDSMRTVVRDTAAWRALWMQINRPFIPAPTLPSIDFDRDMVIVAALGAQPTGGYGIMIESVEEDSAGVAVSVVRSAPGPMTKRPVHFRERTVVVPCGGS
jgi:hypothetical protein